jgi:hypothetical protein
VCLAHGDPVRIELRAAMQASKDLHALAAKVDRHLIEHFFVMEEYVGPLTIRGRA